MGDLLSICKKPKIKKRKKHHEREDKKIITVHSIDGLKKDVDLVGQDSYEIIDKELGENIKYFAVYDGHGARGKLASNFAKDEIKKILVRDKKQISKIKDRKEADKYFKNIFNQVQKKFEKNQDIYELSGTCVIAILLIDNKCFIINLGDSRAVIAAKQSGQKVAFQMSLDHKPNRDDEKRRIDSSGGIVSTERGNLSGPARIYSQNEEGPGLAVSRTLGDIFGHTVGVSCEPEVSFKVIDSDDRYIIIASDGVWDVMNSTEVAGYLLEKEGKKNNINLYNNLNYKETDAINNVVTQNNLKFNYHKETSVEDIVGECRTRWEKVNNYKQKVIDHKKKELESKNTKANYNTNTFSIDDITAIVCNLINN